MTASQAFGARGWSPDAQYGAQGYCQMQVKVKLVTLRGFTSRISVYTTVEWVVTRRRKGMTGLPFPPESSAEACLSSLVPVMAAREGIEQGLPSIVQSANCYSINKHLLSNPCVPRTVLERQIRDCPCSQRISASHERHVGW